MIEDRKTSQEICTRCGMCCDGTLFQKANIGENENLSSGFSFEIIDHEGKGFKLPCPYFRDHFCLIYETRPYVVCSSFECKLLTRFSKEELTFQEAMKIIETAGDLKTKVESQLTESFPDNPADSLAIRMKFFNDIFTTRSGEIEFRKTYGRLLLDYVVLDKHLSTHFRERRDKDKMADKV